MSIRAKMLFGKQIETTTDFSVDFFFRGIFFYFLFWAGFRFPRRPFEVRFKRSLFWLNLRPTRQNQRLSDTTLHNKKFEPSPRANYESRIFFTINKRDEKKSGGGRKVLKSKGEPIGKDAEKSEREHRGKFQRCAHGGRTARGENGRLRRFVETVENALSFHNRASNRAFVG